MASSEVTKKKHLSYDKTQRQKIKRGFKQLATQLLIICIYLRWTLILFKKNYFLSHDEMYFIMYHYSMSPRL